MIIPPARQQTPTTPNEARAKANNLGEADVSGRQSSSDKSYDSSDSSRNSPAPAKGTNRSYDDASPMSNGEFAHSDTDARRVAAFRHGPEGVCDE